MAKGQFPRPTGSEEISIDLVFEFSVPGDSPPDKAAPVSFAVQIFDYPGYFLKSAPPDDPQWDLLVSKLAAAEGFILLAPVQTHGGRKQTAGLAALVEFVAQHAGRMPIGVLLSQWDRRLFNNVTNPASRPVVDPEKEAEDWLSSSSGSEHADFVASIRKIVGPENLAVFASSSAGTMVFQQDIFRNDAARVFRMWPANPDASSSEKPSAPPTAALLVERGGRNYKVEDIDMPGQTIRYRDETGTSRTITFPESGQGSSCEQRINVLMNDDGAGTASYGIEDAFAWLWRRVDERALDFAEQKISESGLFRSLTRSMFARKRIGNGFLFGSGPVIPSDDTMASSLRQRATMLTERLRRLRHRRAALAAVFGSGLLLVVLLGAQTAADAIWASGVRDRMTQPDVATAVELDDLRDIDNYIDAPFRHRLSHYLVWSRADAQVARAGLVKILDRRLLDAITAAAQSDPRSFLNPGTRLALAGLIEQYLGIAPDAAERVADVQRRLLDLEQDIELVRIEFHPATAEARGIYDASEYHFVLLLGGLQVAEYVQTNWLAVPLGRPAPVNDATVVPKQKTVSASLLKAAKVSLCYIEKPSPGSASVSTRTCKQQSIEWAEALRTGKMAIDPAGPVRATVFFEWKPIPPRIPRN
jgi:hypothetical protein